MQRKRVILKKYIPSKVLQEIDKSANCNVPFDVFPEIVAFRDVEPNKSYEIQVTIRNLTNQTLKIRLVKPTTKQFDLKYSSKNLQIVPGLNLKVKVQFECNKKRLENFLDEMRILTESYEKVLVLKAKPKVPAVNYPLLINFGKVSIGQIAQRTIVFSSESDVEFKLSAKDQHIYISQQQIDVLPKSPVSVRIQYKPSAVGLLKSQIDLITHNKIIYKPIEVRGACTDSDVKLLDRSQVQVESINFDKILVGQKCFQSFKLVNNSSKPLCFIIEFQHSEDKRQTGISPRTFMVEKQNSVFSCTPERGTVNAFSEIKLSVQCYYQPTTALLKYFNKVATRTVCAKDHCPDLVRETYIMILRTKRNSHESTQTYLTKYDPLMPRVILTKNIIEFDTVKVYEQTTEQLTVKNESAMAVTIKLDIDSTHSPFDVALPEVIQPDQQTNISVTFCPKKVGVVNEIVSLNILDGMQIDMKFFGKGLLNTTTNKARRLSGLNQNQSQNRLKNSSCHRPKNKSLTDIITRQRQARSAHKLNHLINKKLMQTASISEFDCLRDKAFEAGVFVSPHEQKISLPQSRDSLRRDQVYCQKLEQDLRGDKRIWTDKPKNKREKLEICQSLTDSELKCIVTSSNCIEFGTVFIQSTAIRYFRLKNNTTKFIDVELKNDLEELTLSSPKQIIPPNQHGTFEITLSSDTIGPLKHKIIYILNGQYTFDFIVTANLVETFLQCSTKQVKISLKDDILSFTGSEHFRLINRGNIPATFTFKPYINDTKKFKVEPIMQTVPAKESMEIKVTYEPKFSNCESSSFKNHEEYIYFDVLGGVQGSICCVGYVNEAKCSIKQSEVNLGSVQMGKTIWNKVTLRNVAKLPTVFAVSIEPPLLGKYLKVNEAVQRLASEERRDISLSFSSSIEQVLKGEILVKVRAFKIFRIPFNVNVKTSNLQINEPEINLGRVVINNMYSSSFHIRNDSEIEAVLQIHKISNDQCNLMIFPEKEQEEFIIRYKQFEIYKGLEVEDASMEGIEDDMYSVRVQPKGKLEFKLQFTPLYIKQYRMHLPLKLKNSVGPSQGIIRDLICKSVQPTVLLSTQDIDFKNKIIHDKDETKVITITISNLKNESINWKMNSQAKPPFSIRPLCGVLSACGRETVEISFSPSAPGEYSDRVAVVITGSDVPYLELKLKGKAIRPSVRFNCRQLIFPVVPLGIPSKITFKVENKGYDNIDLSKYRVAETFEGVTIKLQFKDGKNISIIRPKLTVEAYFMSIVPISLTTFIRFQDENCSPFSLAVSGTADNSTLTIFPFLQLNIGRYYINQEEQLIFHADTPASRFEKISHNGKTLNSRNAMRIPTYTFRKGTGSYVMQWLNYFIPEKIMTFPQGLSKTNGSVIFHMLSMLGARIHPDRQLDENSSLQTIVNEYSEMLRMLKKEGCMLNHIRPEFLLDQTLYSEFLLQQSISQIDDLHDPQLSMLNSFQIISSNAWSTLFYQIVKVTLLARVTPKLIKNLLNYLGIEDKPKLSRSNVYCAKQSMIMHFINSLLGDNDCLMTLTNIGFNGKIMPTILDKFIGTDVRGSIRQLNKDSKDQDVRHNATIIVQVLSQFGLKMYLNEQIMVRIQHKEIFLYLLHLLEMLPNYIPARKVIINANLLEECFKQIELTNPTQRTAHYRIKLLGSDTFWVEEQALQIRPHQTNSIKVFFYCRYTMPTSARLFLIDRDPDDIRSRAQPLVFQLESKITTISISKTISFSTRLYQETTCQILVENHLENKRVSDSPLTLSVFISESQNKQPLAFFVQEKPIVIINNKPTKLQVKFLPMIMACHSCHLHFTDPQAGEFIYELIGNVIEPPPLKKIQVRHFLKKTPTIYMMELSARNDLFEAARKKSKKFKLKGAPDKFKVEIIEKNVPVRVPGEFSFPSKLTEEGQLEPIKMPIQFNFEDIYKEYIFHLILKNPQMNDVRVYQINVSVFPLPVTAHLQIKSTPNHQKLQQIPLATYPSKVTLITDSPYLKLCGEIADNLISAGPLNISFKPQWICEAQARLIVEDELTLTQVTYEIEAIGAQPLADNNLDIKLNSQTIHSLQLSMPVGNQSISIDLDMKYCKLVTKATRDKEAFNKTTVSYFLQFEPTDLGIFEGRMKFIDLKTGRYTWTSIRLEVLEAMPTQELVLKTIVGTEKVHEITRMPKGYYEINIQADGVVGDPYFDCSKDSKSIYRFSYNPMIEGEYMGKINFTEVFSKRQFLYFLHLKAQMLPQVIIPPVTCELGKQKTIPVQIKNPSNKSIVYNVSNNNETAYSVQNKIEIRPNSTAVLNVVYTPMRFKVEETTMITLSSQHLFTRRYGLSGMGILPLAIQQVTLKSNINEFSETIIEFKNPFNQKSAFIVHFTDPISQFTHSLTETRGQVQVQALKTHSLAIGFQPKDIKIYQTNLVIEHASRFKWQYKLVGQICISLTDTKNTLIRTVCRETSDHKVQIHSKPMQSINNIIIPPSFSKTLGCAIHEQTQNSLILIFKHQPFKPHDMTKVTIELVHNELIKYQLVMRLEGLVPPVDDKISLQCELESVAIINFRLTNKAKEYKQFQAYFTVDSHLELSVLPKHGYLAPFGSLGTAFTIEFAPMNYRKLYTGKLVIETDDMYWSFEVTGKLPKYIPKALTVKAK